MTRPPDDGDAQAFGLPLGLDRLLHQQIQKADGQVVRLPHRPQIAVIELAVFPCHHGLFRSRRPRSSRLVPDNVIAHDEREHDQHAKDGQQQFLVSPEEGQRTGHARISSNAGTGPAAATKGPEPEHLRRAEQELQGLRRKRIRAPFTQPIGTEVDNLNLP